MTKSNPSYSYTMKKSRMIAPSNNVTNYDVGLAAPQYEYLYSNNDFIF